MTFHVVLLVVGTLINVHKTINYNRPDLMIAHEKNEFDHVKCRRICSSWLENVACIVHRKQVTP